jgi:class 3 adenylate cyclase/tetratricopeptide (TPR) repeat protein
VATLVTEERKVVTVLFADLARSTQLASSLDPERFREVMAAFFKMVSQELASLRGRAEKFIGDAVMAVFGLPHAHDDDALRAVRAGLVIRDRIAQLGEELGLPVPLEVRVGINTGPVATGSGPADQLLVSGAAVNMSARLQEAADPGEVLVGDTTRQLTSRHVEFGPPRAVSAPGFEAEVTAWPVMALSTRSSRRTIPLVDRRRELTLLTEAFERVRETNRAHLFTLLGETGIGKTRLADELVAGLPEEARILTGRANPFEEDVTYAPLADMIRRDLELERGAPAEEVRARLDELVAGCCDASEFEQTAGRLGLALGLGSEGGGGGEGRSYRAAEIRAGLLTLLHGLARSGPVIMVFEDLHLARSGLLELIEQVVVAARRIPLYVLCVARDELLERRPDWGSGIPDGFRLRLEPLSLEESKELAKVAGEGLDPETAARIAERAGGNPFFIIETTGMLLQRHEAHLLGAPHSHLIPPTVQAVVASRIDHLPEEAKDLFRKASVFPSSTFHLSELALIAEPKEEILKILEDAELLLPDPQREGVWRFRHAMLRDVAYESLPKRERLRLHLVVADELAKEADKNPHSLAYHLEQAARASLDLHPEDGTVADRAVRALARAGDLSRRAMESATAVDFYQRALDLAAPEDRWGKDEARILAGLGEAWYWLGEFDRAESVLERALEIGAGDDWIETHAARFLADIALNIRRDRERADALFERAVQAARRLDDPWAMARTLLTAGWAPFWRDDFAAARRTFEEALDIARSNLEGDRWAEARALTSLASAISPVGDEAECLALAEEALAIGRDMGDRFTTAVAQTYVANSRRRMMRLDEALPAMEEAIRIFRDLEARWELASSIGDRAIIHRLAGRLVDAERDLRQSMEVGRTLGDRSVTSWTVAELARTLVARGDVSGARRALEEPPLPIDRLEMSVRTAKVLTDLAAGDRDRAKAEALRLLEEDRAGGFANYVAARVWWVARLFGEEQAGGPDEVAAARETLESHHWLQALREPEMALPETTSARR